MRTRSVLLWPFALVAALLRLLFWPTLVVGLAYVVLVVWLSRPGWFALVAALVGYYTLVVLRIWLTGVRGSMRTMARGTLTVRNQVPRRRPSGVRGGRR
jgi:hypothetical protein